MAVLGARAVGEGVEVRLAEQNRAFVQKLFQAGGVIGGDEVLQKGRRGRRLPALEEKVVLGAENRPGQLAGRPAGFEILFQFPGGCQGLRLVNLGENVELLAGGRLFQSLADRLDRAEPAEPDPADDFLQTVNHPVKIPRIRL